MIFINIAESLTAISSYKDNYLTEHQEAVCRYSICIAREMNLDEDIIKIIRQAALYHDIGKVGIPNSILFKPGKLTDNEWRIMKLHPVIGSELITNKLINEKIIKTVRYHHERWDGNGYPEGLSGEEIPLPARIIAVADAYDAMINSRPYRNALNNEDAVSEILRCAGTQFDPVIVGSFINKCLSNI